MGASFGICHLSLAPSRRSAGCPVRQECLFALADESITGLLSGLDDGDRREVRRVAS